MKDEDSVSGVYVAITTHELLMPGALFSVGPYVLRYIGPLMSARCGAGEAPDLRRARAAGRRVVGSRGILVGLRPGRSGGDRQPALTLGSSGAILVFAPDTQLAARHC